MKASDRTAAELKSLADLPDAEINTSDISEKLDWTGAVRGRFRRSLHAPLPAPIRRNPVTPGLRSAVQRLSEEGMDIYEISSKLGVTPGRVRAIKAHLARGHVTVETASPGQSEATFDDPNLRRQWLSRLQAAARKSASKKKFAFEIENVAFLEELYKQQDGRCAVSGIKFNLERFPAALVKHPFAPSIDRKVSSTGYTKDNVRLVCILANFAMNQWGEEPFITVARGVIERDHASTDALSDVSADSNWESELRNRITTANELLPLLPPGLQGWQRRHIAGLKAALTKGLTRSRAAARQAQDTSKRHRSLQK